MRRVSFWVDDRQYADIKEAAQMRQLSVSEMLRDLVSRKMVKQYELCTVWLYRVGPQGPIEFGVRATTVGRVLQKLRQGQRQEALEVLLERFTSCALFSTRVLDCLEKRYGTGARR